MKKRLATWLVLLLSSMANTEQNSSAPPKHSSQPKPRFPAGLIAHAMLQQELAARARYTKQNPLPGPLASPWELWSLITPDSQAGWLQRYLKGSPRL